MMNGNVKQIVSDILKKRNLGDKFGIAEDDTNTNLISKHYSPLIVIRVDYTYLNDKNLTFVVGVIADPNINGLESVVRTAIKTCEEQNMLISDQSLRDMSGVVSETIVSYYNRIKANSVEGVAILLDCNKTVVSSLYGDFMNHLSCKIEFYNIADRILSNNFHLKNKIQTIASKISRYLDTKNNVQ